MSDENQGYVPTTGSASDMFSRSRQAFAGTPTPQHKPAPTGFACPTCRTNGVTDTMVVSGQGGLRCGRGHKFQDLDELTNQNPDKIPVAQMVRKQENWTPITFDVPKEVATKLQAKFGDKLAASMSSLMMALLEDRNLLVAADDLEMIEKQLGVPDIKSSQQLKGAILTVVAQRSELQGEVTAMKGSGASAGATQNTSGGSTQLRRGEMVVWLNPDQTKKVAERAKEKGVSNEQVVEEYMGQAIDNNWI